MRRLGRRAVTALAVAILLVGGVVALPQIAHELPEPLASVAALPERIWARVVPPGVPRRLRVADLAPAERRAAAGLARRLDAQVVWSSNRSGNHELYLLDVRSGTARRLTDSPHVDFFSRFSPDGRQIVFLRSQREYVTFRDPTAWDVYVIGVDGRGERRIARQGYWPQWTPAGDGVIFARGTQVVRVDLATGREEVILDGETTEGILGGLETPELSPDGRRLALTIRSRKTGGGVGVVDLAAGRASRVAPSGVCQLTWTPDGGLLWIESRGNGGTRVRGLAPGAAPRDATIVMDLPGAYSHEYFPRVSDDGQWLVWGAAAQGHEHDRADYEIFVWRRGEPMDAAVRLTHHGGNDQWPDIHVRR